LSRGNWADNGIFPAQRRETAAIGDATGPKARCPQTLLCMVFLRVPEAKLENGIRSSNALLPFIQEPGYEGSLSNLQRLLAGWRRAAKRKQEGRISEHQILEPVRDPETGHPKSPVAMRFKGILRNRSPPGSTTRSKLTLRHRTVRSHLKQGH